MLMLLVRQGKSRLIWKVRDLGIGEHTSIDQASEHQHIFLLTPIRSEYSNPRRLAKVVSLMNLPTTRACA